MVLLRYILLNKNLSFKTIVSFSPNKILNLFLCKFITLKIISENGPEENLYLAFIIILIKFCFI